MSPDVKNGRAYKAEGWGKGTWKGTCVTMTSSEGYLNGRNRTIVRLNPYIVEPFFYFQNFQLTKNYLHQAICHALTKKSVKFHLFIDIFGRDMGRFRPNFGNQNGRRHFVLQKPFRNLFVTEAGNDVIHHDVTMNVSWRSQYRPSVVIDRFLAS